MLDEAERANVRRKNRN